MLRFIVAAISILIPALSNADEEVLARLVEDYRNYELPAPSAHAQLVLRQHGGDFVNGVPKYTYDLALRDEVGGSDVHWIGMFSEKPVGTIIETISTPSAELVSRTKTARPRQQRLGAGQDVDLVLAIHCEKRGWNDLAQALLIRSKTDPSDVRSARRPKRPRDDRARLAMATWAYWCEELIRESGDRTPIVDRLKALAVGEWPLNTPAHVNLLADMESTLARPGRPASKLEAAVDSLIDLGEERRDGDIYFANVRSASRSSGAYREIRDAGLDAVPVLLAHLDDFRLTRCVGSSRRGTWHARIADVVALLLDEIATEEFSYDLLIAQGRGKQLDRAHVLHWWTGLQGTEALEYLKGHALKVEEK
jgi:hypothetical protein